MHQDGLARFQDFQPKSQTHTEKAIYNITNALYSKLVIRHPQFSLYLHETPAYRPRARHCG